MRRPQASFTPPHPVFVLSSGVFVGSPPPPLNPSRRTPSSQHPFLGAENAGRPTALPQAHHRRSAVDGLGDVALQAVSCRETSALGRARGKGAGASERGRPNPEVSRATDRVAGASKRLSADIILCSP
ncbi:hypothetical protein A1Q2_00210 [Trichosporon asahii var. asahii CBS 8904]|uniref:Uncharacterized protein n=1 Tax=Trichosporon asahii var. asahii (strain CBS 8904) TaxID=1220162 RepID=K1WXN2_TRIAC|nr:hypothetical protein A1Q2_00210 [Trichosporon asahii var. asahii CBS 8904]